MLLQQYMYNVCTNNLSREEREKESKSKINKWKSKVNKERNKLYDENNKHVEELNHVKRY